MLEEYFLHPKGQLAHEQYEARLKRGEANRSRSGNLILIACDSGRYLAERVVEEYNRMLELNGCDEKIRLLNSETKRFADGTFEPYLNESVTGGDVYIIQSPFDPSTHREKNPEKHRSVNDNYMEFKQYLRAAKMHGAKTCVGVYTYDPFGRSDKQEAEKRTIAVAKLEAEEIVNAGASRLITFNFHNPSIREFYDIPVDPINLSFFAIKAFDQYKNRSDTMVLGPDKGSIGLVRKVATPLGLRSSTGDKVRPAANEAVIEDVNADFRGIERALIIDDIGDTMGSVEGLIDFITKNTKIKEFEMFLMYPLLNKKGSVEALERLDNLYDGGKGPLKKFYFPNTVNQTEEIKNRPYVSEIDITPVVTLAINHRHYGQSISGMFK